MNSDHLPNIATVNIKQIYEPKLYVFIYLYIYVHKLLYTISFISVYALIQPLKTDPISPMSEIRYISKKKPKASHRQYNTETVFVYIAKFTQSIKHVL